MINLLHKPALSLDSVISESLCREPDPRPVQKFANGGPVDAAATQVSHRRERKGGGKVVWRCRGAGLKIHPPLVWAGPTRAGERRVAWTGSLVLPELALQHLDFIDQLGELVVGGAGASFGNAGFRNPAQKVELPESHVWWREQGDQEALLVGGSREPVPEEALWRAFVFHCWQIRLQLRHQRAPSGQCVLSTPQSVAQSCRRSSQCGTVGFLLEEGHGSFSENNLTWFNQMFSISASLLRYQILMILKLKEETMIYFLCNNSPCMRFLMTQKQKHCPWNLSSNNQTADCMTYLC